MVQVNSAPIMFKPNFSSLYLLPHINTIKEIIKQIELPFKRIWCESDANSAAKMYCISLNDKYAFYHSIEIFIWYCKAFRALLLQRNKTLHHSDFFFSSWNSLFPGGPWCYNHLLSRSTQFCIIVAKTPGL